MASDSTRRTGLRDTLLPEVQRRTLEELTGELDLTSGDTRSKRSAFWTMLALSAVIASAGVLADSTATVIGAMIIAPLSTPIMGIALSIVKQQPTGGIRFALLGGTLVVVIGVAFALVLPDSYDLVGNSQIAGRTAPGALDLVAAVATGLAGAVALARRDVAAVLPGVAISISLVPPLAVVGLCAGQGSFLLALGALLLFLSNLLALVLSGTLVFAMLGYAEEAIQHSGRPSRRASITVGALLLVVSLPLVGNTLASYALSVWTGRVQSAASEWIDDTPGASITKVEGVATSFYVYVQTPQDLPPVDLLVADLEGSIPDGFEVVVESSRGERLEPRTIGG
ncbi:MAG TPA: DUF389 domain-containing protein [Nocardioides sp.]|uniref:DUF389 domain-containing protein n=1 Tax=Nocardioides sp. TaxID=35761 RepID=UPI002BD9B814|nr:DUF389 domain-containing protein [Nocardioides sp.]HQR25498.1 DUF389 domain-containing protein [Nocardioides sp.]